MRVYHFSNKPTKFQIIELAFKNKMKKMEKMEMEKKKSFEMKSLK